MKQVWRNVVIAGVALLVAVPAFAQGPGPGDGPRHGRRGGGREGFHPEGGPQGGSGRFIERMLEPKVAEKLGLEPEQIKRLEKGIQHIKEREEALHDKLKQAGRKQAELLMEEEVDEDALMTAIEETGRIRTQMAKLRVKPILLVKQTLTTEQVEEARKLMHRGRQQQRGQGREGRAGGGRDGRKRGWMPGPGDGPMEDEPIED